MNSIEISVPINQKAALLKGLALNDRETVRVSPSEIGEELWPYLVEALRVDVKPPALQPSTYHFVSLGTYLHVKSVSEASPAAVRDMLQQALDEAKERGVALAKRAEEQNTEAIEFLRGRLAAIQSMGFVEADLAVCRNADGEIEVKESWKGTPQLANEHEVSVRGWRLPDGYPSPETRTIAKESENPDLVAERDRLIAEARSALDAKKEERDHLNEVAVANEHERLVAELAAKEEERERKAAEAVRKIAAAKARRLETGEWEYSYVDYNARRYGAPWCAKVDFSAGAKGEYAFGETSGQWGKAGVLSLAGLKPGDYIALGQKDLRRPGASDHSVGKILADGGVQWFDSKADAYADWKANRP